MKRQLRQLRTIQRTAGVGISSLALLTLAGCGMSATQQNQLSPPNLATTRASNQTESNVADSQMMGLNQTPKPMKIVRTGSSVSIDMYTEETEVEIAPGVMFPAWTFDGTVPGPVIELRQGDHVTLTLHNIDPNMSHSIDLHAALVAPDQNFVDVAPGKTRTIHFDASLPGVFMYIVKPPPWHFISHRVCTGLLSSHQRVNSRLPTRLFKASSTSR